MISITPQRLPTESQHEYRVRRAAGNRAIRNYLRGRLTHISSQALVLPLAGVDVNLDRQIINQRIRDVTFVTVKVPTAGRKIGDQFRVGRSKGVTFRWYPAGRDRREWREIERRFQ